MPFFVVYSVSWFAYVLAYYVTGYRKKTVIMNLRNSFPEKTPEEVRKIAKKFYRNFMDVMVEVVKGVTMSENALKERFIPVNPDMLDKLYEMNQSVIVVGAHYANSEWGKVLSRIQRHPIITIYSPFMNRDADAIYNRSREKFGMIVVPYEKTLRAFMDHRGSPHCYIMGVDQRPFEKKNAFWVRFLNQDTPCHKGFEQIARRFNIPVVYSDIRRLKKGHYSLKYMMLSEEPAKTEEGYIVTRFMQNLESIIREKPEDWLWSHKRWKFTRDSEEMDQNPEKN
jgi:KDO2-lipid IV(A) lauroyltransferase